MLEETTTRNADVHLIMWIPFTVMIKISCVLISCLE